MTIKQDVVSKKKSQIDIKNRKDEKDEDEKSVIIPENINNHHGLEYISSLLHELKHLADQSGYKLLYHLINMAEIEAEDIQNINNSKIEEEKHKAHSPPG